MLCNGPQQRRLKKECDVRRSPTCSVGHRSFRQQRRRSGDRRRVLPQTAETHAGLTTRVRPEGDRREEEKSPQAFTHHAGEPGGMLTTCRSRTFAPRDRSRPEPALKRGTRFSRRSSSQNIVDGDVLVEVRPMNSLTARHESPPASLGNRSMSKARVAKNSCHAVRMCSSYRSMRA